jgi:hypothetical protein
MLHQNQLIHFYEESYLAYKNQIREHGQILIEAAREMRKLELPKVDPNNLRDGFFVQRVLDFHKQEWKKNEAFKKVYFEKYLEFIELDYSKVEELESLYNRSKNQVYSFYKFNNYYLRNSGSESITGTMKPGAKVDLKLSDLYEIKGNTVVVNLDDKYFRLFSTSKKQLEKIESIKQYIEAARSLEMDFKLVKSALGRLLKYLRFDLSTYEINYFEIMHRYN